MPPFRPKPAFEWHADRNDGPAGGVRSTAQDSFKSPPVGMKQLPSCKPNRVYEPTEWMQPLTTTTQSLAYGAADAATKPVHVDQDA